MERVDRRRALQETLSRLGMIVDGVQACAIVDRDGFALATHPAGGDGASVADGAQVAAAAAMLTGSAERALDRLAQGRMSRLLLEGEEGSLLSCPAGPVTLAVVIAPGASLGHVLFAAQKAAAEVDSILAE